MTVVRKKPGPPSKDEPRKPLHLVNFKADVETIAAIEALVEAAKAVGGHSLVGIKSAVIRQTLIEAAGRISRGSKR
jgi:hypothetical protein